MLTQASLFIGVCVSATRTDGYLSDTLVLREQSCPMLTWTISVKALLRVGQTLAWV